MPTPLLAVRHLRQESSYACLAACARMVLAYYGDPRSEEELARKLGVKRYGTPLANLRRLADWGYEVELEQATLVELADWLDAGVPPIVAVNAGRFPYWPAETGFHAVVVVCVDDEQILLNDPFVPDAPMAVRRDDFQAAWSEQFFHAAMIRG